MAFTAIESIRIELADNDPAFPLLSDDEYQYYLDKHSGSIGRASIDAAKTILFKLAQESDETVNIFSIKGSKTAEAYKNSLEMYLKNSSLNPLYNSAGAYAAGVSKADVLSYQTIDSTIRTFEF